MESFVSFGIRLIVSIFKQKPYFFITEFSNIFFSCTGKAPFTDALASTFTLKRRRNPNVKGLRHSFLESHYRPKNVALMKLCVYDRAVLLVRPRSFVFEGCRISFL